MTQNPAIWKEQTADEWWQMRVLHIFSPADELNHNLRSHLKNHDSCALLGFLIRKLIAAWLDGNCQTYRSPDVDLYIKIEFATPERSILNPNSLRDQWAHDKDTSL